MLMMKGKKILLGITGSIAAYKVYLPGKVAGKVRRRSKSDHDAFGKRLCFITYFINT